MDLLNKLILLLMISEIVNEGFCAVGTINAALRKPSNQSSTYSTGVSSLAVDGNANSDYSANSCSHTEGNDKNPWWAVDLQKIYRIVSVTLTNRNWDDPSNPRLSHFSILGSTQSYALTNNSLEVCRNETNHVLKGETKQYNCTGDLYSRFIIIQKTKKDAIFLTLCEVVVTAECLNGTYGENCSNICSDKCLSKLPCDKKYGNCATEECKPGYKGNMCEEECPDGTYGDRCKYNCSVHCLESICEKHTNNGLCKGEKCKPGYLYGNCTTDCNDGSYGDNCQKECPVNCGNSKPCDKETGHCLTDCKTGYMGDMCDKKCSSGLFGDNCAQSCPTNCQDSLCDYITGDCTTGCVQGFSGEKCLTEVAGSLSSVGAAVGGVLLAAIIIILLVILVIFFIRKRKARPRTHMKEEHFTNGGPMTELNLAMFPLKDDSFQQADGIEKPVLIPRKGAKNGNTDYVTDEQNMIYANVAESESLVKVEDLHTYVADKKTQEEPFKEEYERIPNKVYSCDQCAIELLKCKNRYKNIYPYDNNRVMLQQIGEDSLSKYINASYIKDYNGNISYIAALGTTVQTIPDFWRMIWEQNICLVVMVTNLVEQMKVKCEQYWPTTMNTDLCIDGTIIALEKESIMPTYVMRTLKISKGNSHRLIDHYQYTAWPDKTVPDHLHSLCKIRNVMKKYREQLKTPILVHCSAGVGRTGTIIALDILLEQAEAEKKVDVYKCVEMLRTQRISMVQTLVQYVFLHDALMEILYAGTTAIPIKSFDKFFLSAEYKVKIAQQFQTLENLKPVYKADDLEFGKMNTKDNRNSAIIPADSHRAKIPSSPEVYLNAVYVPSYIKKFGYIATQIPLPHTTDTFWRMIYELHCPHIVCLEGDSKEWFSSEKGSVMIGDLNLIITGKKTVNMLTTYDISIGPDSESMYANVEEKETEAKVAHNLQLYLIQEWSRIAVNQRDAGTLFESLNYLKKKTGTELCTVICRNGATECGLYIASSWLLEMINEEEVVDIFHVVKQIRKPRPQFINSLDQYEFLHRIVQEETIDADLYENVIKQ